MAWARPYPLLHGEVASYPPVSVFRSLLVAARERAGVSQSAVAGRLGRPQSFVAKYEGGERRLDVVEFIQVCAALGVDPAALIGDLKSWPGT